MIPLLRDRKWLSWRCSSRNGSEGGGGITVSDVILIAILVAFFALAIALVQVLGRMIDRDTDQDEPR